MIVSHEWIKQFVPHTLSAEQVGEALSRHCVTLDGITTLGAELSAFVVAQVVEAGRHPNSERLWVTKVDDGSGELLEVVCGAPNVVAGHKYPFARTGTVMPGGLKIEKRKIRGETSNGMLCSARELGLGEEHDGILTLDTDAAPGTALLEIIKLGDARLDLDVLPNRPDLLSHVGVAREVSAISGTPLSTVPAELTTAVSTLAAVEGKTAARGQLASVIVDDAESCPRFVGVVIQGVQVGASPAWLRQRLESIGLRSISNVVDATNYVLHGLGHPVHAYDLGTLKDRTITVRPTRADETSLTTLDGVSRVVAAGTTVICDGERPIGFAGVMGGLDTEVTERTTDVLLELAVFDARFVRRVRRAVALSTDASYRFERGVDAQDAEIVARRAAALITQVAGGTVAEVLVVGEAPAARGAVTLRPSRLARLLGVDVSTAEIVRRLESLGCVVQPLGDALLVQAPGWRHDLGLEVDLIEEVARLVGFDALPDELRPFRPGNAPDHPLHLASRRVRDVLVGIGMAEARPMPFTSTGDEHTPRVRNPLADDEPFLRASVLDTLARRAEYNLSRMQGNLRLFEIGNVFTPRDGRLPIEETRVGALLMGARRPAHFSEPEPPAFDAWDAKELGARVATAAFPGRAVSLQPADGALEWAIVVDDVGTVGQVSAVPLDRPLWATEAWGVEVTLGVVSSDDVAGANQHAHTPAERESGATRAVRFAPLPTTPAAEFDMALLVPDAVTAATVQEVLRRTAGELLEQVTLFDEFRGPGVPDGTRSLGWRLTWRHPERTLRDKELEGRRARLLEVLDKELGIRPRAS
ncbi:MAG TPA: phenylalanine--tRNA ligase subunit beta [Gemmatimonas aurantiaca]|uniref:Phenylalanine--tRNA ligase beta subunit n=2 Tax=Gemmatimonas aurantiaca TaxID=173480 RepID=C1A491_GEMAT|nr:phenylalanine--tRNA ligase subunit beta [Gemmatimonas aurantiaca]BAH38916.1 phenylalanyl-tRNA synthetase beta chain [Gemmatimonas aurantiaca T-27]HCT57198.1 phenylalanine--tRNA ligase subunit beta [Gemmatimonas aurantiaca]